jgi:hypothetical protein
VHLDVTGRNLLCELHTSDAHKSQRACMHITRTCQWSARYLLPTAEAWLRAKGRTCVQLVVCSLIGSCSSTMLHDVNTVDLCKINITGVVGQMATRWWWLWSMMSSGSSCERNGRLTTCACVRACVRGIRSTRVGSREQLTLLSCLMCAMLDACGVFKITAQASERASVFPRSSCFKTPRMRVHAHECHVSRNGHKTARCTVQRFELKPLCDGNKAPAHARQQQKKDRNTGNELVNKKPQRHAKHMLEIQLQAILSRHQKQTNAARVVGGGGAQIECGGRVLARFCRRARVSE